MMTPAKSESTGRYERRTSIGTSEETHDYWSAIVDGRFVTIHFGRVGTSGHKASREFRNNQEARDFMLERLKVQMDKGYTLVD
jgi:predicted DNA-binding WGR domain protein